MKKRFLSIAFLVFKCFSSGVAWSSHRKHGRPVHFVASVAPMYKESLDQQLLAVNSSFFTIELQSTSNSETTNFKLFIQDTSDVTSLQHEVRTFLTNLPANRLSLRCHLGQDQIDVIRVKSKIEDAILFWEAVQHDRCYRRFTATGELICFKTVPKMRVSSPRTHVPARRRKKMSSGSFQLVSAQFVTEMNHLLSSMAPSTTQAWSESMSSGTETVEVNFQLKSEASMDPAATKCNTDDNLVLELSILTRVYPLRIIPPGDRQVSPSQNGGSLSKRLESFLLAKTANIQPGDIVLDPFCQRGTVLIEGAKHWPSAAAFVGISSDLGDLDHARMNADSTFTCLDLYYCPNHNETGQRLFPQWNNTMNKIVTCMPSGKSLEFYLSRIMEWSKLLKGNGLMVLAVDKKALGFLIEALNGEKIILSFVALRETPISWGNDKVTIVVLRPSSAFVRIKNEELPWVSELSWETSSSLDAANAIRLETIPSLVSMARADQMKHARNKIFMSSGKVYRSSHG